MPDIRKTFERPLTIRDGVLTVRPATLDDVQAVVGVMASDAPLRTRRFSEQATPAVRRMVEAGLLLVAEQAGAGVRAFVETRGVRSATDPELGAMLVTVTTKPEVAGGGIRGELVSEVARRLFASGYDEVVTSVDSLDATAMDEARSFGFKGDGEAGIGPVQVTPLGPEGPSFRDPGIGRGGGKANLSRRSDMPGPG